MMSTKAVCVGFLLLAFGAEAGKAASKVDVTPMQKVVSLLTDLTAKVTAEGKAEATEYDKFSCFCKEEATEYQTAIEASTKKIDLLFAKVGKLAGEINALAEEVRVGMLDMSDEEKLIVVQQRARKQEHVVYVQADERITEAITATSDAGKMLSAHLDNITDYMSDRSARGEGTKTILQVVKTLLTEEKQQDASQDSEEGSDEVNTDATILSENNIIKFTAKTVWDLEQVSAAKEAEKNAAAEEQRLEEAARTADRNALGVVTAQCEAKATMFDQRSLSRSNELTAMTEAITALNTGMPPKGTTGIMAKGASFLQLGRGSSKVAGEKKALERVRSYLAKVVKATGSTALSTLAIRVQVSGDRFSKVRNLITDMIAKLNLDKTSEFTQKGLCDSAMSNGISNRDTAQGHIEAANAAFTTDTALVAARTDEINVLLAENAADLKAFNEATELRAIEKANNEKTIELSETALVGVEEAIRVLQAYYGFVQVSSHKYTPPNADRDGKAFADKAPKVFQEEYHGAQTASTGVIGILEVVKSDFERVRDQTEDVDESNSADEFVALDAAINGVLNDGDTETTGGFINGRNAQILAKNGEISDANTRLVTTKSTLKTNKELRDAGLAKIESVRAECLDGAGGEAHETRKQARLKEIAALKEAREIMDTWTK